MKMTRYIAVIVTCFSLINVLNIQAKTVDTLQSCKERTVEEKTKTTSIGAEGGEVFISYGPLAQFEPGFLRENIEVSIKTVNAPITYKGIDFGFGFGDRDTDLICPVGPHTIVSLPFGAVDLESSDMLFIAVPTFPNSYDEDSYLSAQLRILNAEGESILLSAIYEPGYRDVIIIAPELLAALFPDRSQHPEVLEIHVLPVDTYLMFNTPNSQ